MIRWAAAVAVLALSGWMSAAYAIRPILADAAVVRAESELRRSGTETVALTRVRLAREAVRSAEEAIARDPLRIDGYVLAGLGSFAGNRFETAVDFYCRGLRIDRRPEMFAGLALAERAAGDDERARKHFALAGASRVALLQTIRDPVLRSEVYGLAQRLAIPERNLIRNSDFSRGRNLSSEEGVVVSKNETVDLWTLFSWKSVPTRVNLEERGSERILRVEAGARGGIGQMLSLPIRPAAVTATADIRVTRGKVGLAAGRNWRQNPVVVEPSDERHTVEFASENCPVVWVAAICVESDCAFELAEISATADLSLTCDFPTGKPLPDSLAQSSVADAIPCGR
jgi:hypothetical protein